MHGESSSAATDTMRARAILLLLSLDAAGAQITCTVHSGSTCYPDFKDGKTRYLTNDVENTSPSMTKELCASICFGVTHP